MKKLVCEICGGANIAKENGIFICKDCGCQYAEADVKKLLVEVNDENAPVAAPVVNAQVSNVTPQINSKLQNLYDVARRARETNNTEQALEYYNLILREDPNNWEPVFYTVYYSAMNCKIAGIASAAISVENSLKSVYRLIDAADISDEEKDDNILTVADDCFRLGRMLAGSSLSHYKDIDISIRNKYDGECVDRIKAVENMLLEVADAATSVFGKTSTVSSICVAVCEVLMGIYDANAGRGMPKRCDREVCYYSYKKQLVEEKLEFERIKLVEKIGNDKDSFYQVTIEDFPKTEDLTKLNTHCLVLETLGNYKDAPQKLVECQNRINEIKYKNATALMEKGEYEQAIAAFKEIEDFGDASAKNDECQALIKKANAKAEEAKKLAEDEKKKKKAKKKKKRRLICFIIFVLIPAIAFGVVFGSCFTCHKQFTDIKTMVIYGDDTNYTLAVKNDGTVVSTGHPLLDGYYDGLDNVGGIVKIVYADCYALYALRDNGTVVRRGNASLDVSDWTDIVDISATASFVVGVKSDGTVNIKLSEYYQEEFADTYDVSEWTDIVSVAAHDPEMNNGYIVGLKSDGTLVGCGVIGEGDNITLISQQIDDLTDVVSIAASSTFVAVHSDGTVDTFGKLTVDGYNYVEPTIINNVKSASVSTSNIAYLLKDGSVVVFGDNRYNQCDVSTWSDIVEVSIREETVYGLKSDGTMVASGPNWGNRANVDKDNIRLDF